MKLREWVRRNWLEPGVLAFLAIMFSSVALIALKVKAQQPAQKSVEQPNPLASYDVLRKDKTYTVRFSGEQVLKDWIEQHCVAVPECDHGSAEARCGLSGSLKLRCTPDPEPKP